MSTRREFENSPVAVARARRFVADEVTGVPADVAAEIAIMVSELATNSVRHTATAFSVSVDRTASRIRIEVTDTGTGVPTVRSPGALEPSGRGLRIVRELADAFGIDDVPGGPGKTVWFVVDLDKVAGDVAERATGVTRDEPQGSPARRARPVGGSRARGRDGSSSSPEARSRPRGMRGRPRPRRRDSGLHSSNRLRWSGEVRDWQAEGSERN
jgi:anti-sigma regulatory factor (Ser/Thr protein kinase)